MTPDVKEKHPNWFKMKIERRELIRQLAPETAVRVLLACWEYLETGEKPGDLSPIESIAFSAFIPDMEEAWTRYLQRVSSGTKGGRPKNHTVPYGGKRYRTAPNGTEEETEPETEPEPEKESVADKPPRATRFTPPTVKEVEEYCRERKNNIDPARFVDFYSSKDWMIGKNKMRDWRAAVRNWERRDDGKKAASIPSEADYYQGWGDAL